jgi:hypothetical protein
MIMNLKPWAKGEMTFRQYVEYMESREIPDEEWHEPLDYDSLEDKYFGDYLDDMRSIGYEPECGLDY